MGRLTYRSPALHNAVLYGACEGVECCSDCDNCKIGAIIYKLCAYEDTGLEPEEVVALQASNQELKREALPLLQAKIQGKMVVLPCKLGDTVYATFRLRGGYLREKNKPYPCEVVFIGISKEPFMHIQFESGQVFQVDFETIGKTVFTTKEAAEAALKEREG